MTGPLRILLITHADLAQDPSKSQSRFVAALSDLAEVAVVGWDALKERSIAEVGRIAGTEPSAFDSCVFFVRFQRLCDGPPFTWKGFDGLRVWIEHDAFTDFMPGRPRQSLRFSAVYRRDKFHLMISTGKQTTALLHGEGVNAHWIPKGYADDVFEDVGLERSGACTFGTAWPSRRALADHLRRRGVELTDVSGPFETLNERLNRHLAGVVCNMAGGAPGGRLGRQINRRWPLFVRTSPGIEPMIKTFETAAAGCAPVLDHIDELQDLGFVAGETCFTYRSFDEAAAILRSASPDELRAVGRAAAELARGRHTWRHRAEATCDLLRCHVESA